MAGKIGCLSKGLEQRLHHVMRFLAIQQFKVQVAAGFIGETLEKFPGQAEAKATGVILILFLSLIKIS